MPPTRINVDALAWPLWALALCHLALAAVVAAMFFDGVQQRQEARETIERTQQQLEKSLNRMRE
jgi:hypothetical protein